MPEIYRGVNGVNKLITQQFRGVSGVNREIKEQYRGVNGINRLVFKRGYNIEDINKMTFEYTISPYPADGYAGSTSDYYVKVSKETDYYNIYARGYFEYKGMQLNGSYNIIFNDGIKIPFIKNNIRNSFYNTINDITLKFWNYGIVRLKWRDENDNFSGRSLITMFGTDYGSKDNFIASGTYGYDGTEIFKSIEEYPESNIIDLKARSDKAEHVGNWAYNTIPEIEYNVPTFEFTSNISTRKILPELIKL